MAQVAVTLDRLNCKHFRLYINMYAILHSTAEVGKDRSALFYNNFIRTWGSGESQKRKRNSGSQG